MNIENLLSSRVVMVGAAIVGIVGAAGVFIYEQVNAEKRRAMLVNEVARLDRQVTSMRTELEALRELQKESQLRRLKNKKNHHRREKSKLKSAPIGDVIDAPEVPEQSYTSDSEYYTDYQSVIGTDAEGDSDEFYDVHTDDEDDTLKESVRNGHSLSDELDQDILDEAPTLPVNNRTKE